MDNDDWTHRGFVVLCCGCAKIRDKSGAWRVTTRLLAEDKRIVWSHGLCPECMFRFYGNEEWYKGYCDKVLRHITR